MIKKIALAVFMAGALIGCQTKKEESRSQLIDYVDPFIGTGGKGNTYPGATMPFGRIQLSPDNGRNGWDWISGYYYPDTVIAGFSHTHLSGTGAGDLYDISYLPTSGELKTAFLDSISSEKTVYSRFSHENEQAKPGYYQVYLEDYKINVELSATDRVGVQRYTFEGNDNKVRLNLGYSRNWDKTTSGRIAFLNDSTIVGHRFSTGWARDQKVFFVSIFSKPMKNYELYESGEKQPQKELFGEDILAVIDMGTTKDVSIKTAISSISVNQAIQNMLVENKTKDFDAVKRAAQFHWEVALAKVSVKTSEDNKVQFYTAMYHSMLAPTIYSDVDGGFYGPTGKSGKAQGYNRYSTFSLWDTFRAQHPWLTITQPKRVPDFIQSMLAFQKETGKLPVWNLLDSETNMMIGYHAVPVIADAILKGFEVDTLQAFEAMKASAMQQELNLDQYRELGYFPSDQNGWSVSKTMEYAYDDWCIAQVANLLGKKSDADYFMERSKNYLNHFDEETRYFRAKTTGGSFREDFDPKAYYPEDYCEANAMQYHWYVPHDIPNLITLTGGEKAFENRLDEMFMTSQQANSEDPEWISGYIGQYVHGNEPSHHVPYLYQYVGANHKTQKWVRRIMDELYTTKPDGLAGNEDCGQMSAWYLFSALGFYPVNPADGRYILGSPEVNEAIISLGEGKTFTIKASNQSADHVYVKKVTLNGKVLDEIFISHQQIIEGGELVFEMTSSPPR